MPKLVFLNGAHLMFPKSANFVGNDIVRRNSSFVVSGIRSGLQGSKVSPKGKPRLGFNVSRIRSGLRRFLYQVWASTFWASVLGFHISGIWSGLRLFRVSPFTVSGLGFNVLVLGFQLLVLASRFWLWAFRFHI